MTQHSARILRVAYNNVHRKILKFHTRCSASQMFADNNILNFEALTLYDPGGGGALEAPPPPIFCPHAFNFGATILCVGDFSPKIV